MAQKRQWDESRSPQWRYLLSKDSYEKREAEKREERAERAEGELLKRGGVSKRKRANQERHKEKRALTRITKAGKEIVYSASPGGEKNRYVNEEFEKSHNNKISITFENETTTPTE